MRPWRWSILKTLMQKTSMAQCWEIFRSRWADEVYERYLHPCRKGKDNSKDVRLRTESGDESVAASQWGGALLVAAGTDPYDLVDSAVAAAAQLSGGAKPRLSKQLPDFVGSFGWCTWDAFYSQVSAQGEYHVQLCFYNVLVWTEAIYRNGISLVCLACYQKGPRDRQGHSESKPENCGWSCA